MSAHVELRPPGEEFDEPNPSAGPPANTLLELDSNPFMPEIDPSGSLTERLTFPSEVPAQTFEGVVDQLLDGDPNAAGFMRKPVRAMFLSHPEEQLEAALAACPELSPVEYRALRFYSENYYREINGSLRQGFHCPPQTATVALNSNCNWRFLRLIWWIHQGVLKLGNVQVPISVGYRWHKLTRWHCWTIGEIFESNTFMSMTGPEPNLEATRYGDHFGHLLLVLDLQDAPPTCMADISYCSKFEGEGEALLLPWLAFRVTAVKAFDDIEQATWQAVQSVHLKCLGWRFDVLGQDKVTHDPNSTKKCAVS